MDKLSDGTVHEAYQLVRSYGVADGMSIFVALIGVIIMVLKLMGEYDKATLENKDLTVKEFLKMVRVYFVTLIVIAVFPFILPLIETLLAHIQDGLKGLYTTSVNTAADQAIDNFMEDYIAELDAQREELNNADGMFDQLINNLILTIKELQQELIVGIYTGVIYVLKYIYFMFCCGRYLWLIMLEIVAPVAIILGLYKDTRSYFYTWLKYMFLCYLLIPFFLVADLFSEGIIKILFTDSFFDATGTLGLIAMVVVKISMYGYVAKKSVKLI